MQTKILRSLLIGIVATIAMTLFMVLGTAIGLPALRPPDMLAEMMGVSIAVGWVLHFMIGIIFAAAYIFLFNNWLKKISDRVLRGAVYGVIVFILAQISLPVLEAIFGDEGTAAPEGSMLMMMIASLTGHIIFGIVIALIAKPVDTVKRIE